MLKVLIGNKSDLPKERRKISLLDGKDYAGKRGMEFFETSAKVNDGKI